MANPEWGTKMENESSLFGSFSITSGPVTDHNAQPPHPPQVWDIYSCIKNISFQPDIQGN